MYSRYNYLLTTAAWLLLICISTVSSLECYECDDLTPGINMCDNAVSKPCEQSFHDICVKIITTQQQPNNGPEDRMRDNKELTYVKKGCANRAAFTPQLANKLDWCDVETVGGGGEQSRCICAGNDCNSVGRVEAATFLTLLAVSGLLVLFQ